VFALRSTSATDPHRPRKGQQARQKQRERRGSAGRLASLECGRPHHDRVWRVRIIKEQDGSTIGAILSIDGIAPDGIAP